MKVLKGISFFFLSFILYLVPVVTEFVFALTDIGVLNINLDVIFLVVIFYVAGYFPNIFAIYLVGLLKDALFSHPMGITPLCYSIIIFFYAHLFQGKNFFMKRTLCFSFITFILSVMNYSVSVFLYHESISLKLVFDSYLYTFLLYSIISCCLGLRKFSPELVVPKV